jgi:hypothetical protein
MISEPGHISRRVMRVHVHRGGINTIALNPFSVSFVRQVRSCSKLGDKTV